MPEVCDLQRLDRLLDGWDGARRILFCDEGLAGASPALPGFFRDKGAAPPDSGPWAILIGPEGGFSEAERTRLRALDHAHPIRLGPRILRADTAAVAALTLWQVTLGDWA